MITLAMLVKDPPIDRLTLLLQYVSPVIHQVVIVVDDRTDMATLMRALPGDTYVQPFHWCDDFSAARNAALPHITGDWTLWLDPDELPSAAMLDFVRMVDASPWTPGVMWCDRFYAEPRGYLFYRMDFTDGIPGEQNEAQWHCRLFRTDRGKWYRPVHELVELDGQPETTTRESTRLRKAPRSAYLIHSRIEDPAKHEQYARIAASVGMEGPV